MKTYFRKIFSLSFYYRKIKTVIKKILIYKLLFAKKAFTMFIPPWHLNIGETASTYNEYNKKDWNVFGTIIRKEDIVWNKDYVSGYQFNQVRIDKIKVEKYFNRGVDVRFPWELSRLTYLNSLACTYAINLNHNIYVDFKGIIKSWIESNPFLYGINWKCTMDISIRAINMIISGTAFYKELEKDPEFLKAFSCSLIEHAEYISTFPEIYPNNHSTNHTIADFTGLLMLAKALPDHPKSEKWFQQAKEGIIQCMDYQVNEEGVHFESSVPYHRLVTELFSLTYLVCSETHELLPEIYLMKLYKMFAFIASLIHTDGSVPMFGDNDSSSIINIDYTRNHDYSCLMALGKLIFGKDFIVWNKPVEVPCLFLLPTPKKSNNSILTGDNLINNGDFNRSGYYILKNEHFKSCIGLLSIRQNKVGAHNHLDLGSFTLVSREIPLVVDPGSFTYTRDIKIRNKFKSYHYHNVLIPDDYVEELKERDPFRTNEYYKLIHVENDINYLTFEYVLNGLTKPIKRSFSLNKSEFIIENNYPNPYKLRLNFADHIERPENNSSSLYLRGFTIELTGVTSISMENYDFSPAYGIKTVAWCAILSATGTTRLTITTRL